MEAVANINKEIIEPFPTASLSAATTVATYWFGILGTRLAIYSAT